MARPSKQLNLSEAELTRLNEVFYECESGTQKFRRVCILLMVNEGTSCKDIAASGEGSSATISNVKRKYFERGLEYALVEQSRSGAPRRISPQDEDAILLLSSLPPPERCTRWTLRLLAEKAVENGFVKSISHNQIKIILRKHNRQLV